MNKENVTPRTPLSSKQNKIPDGPPELIRQRGYYNRVGFGVVDIDRNSNKTATAIHGMFDYCNRMNSEVNVHLIPRQFKFLKVMIDGVVYDLCTRRRVNREDVITTSEIDGINPHAFNAWKRKYIVKSS